MMILDMMGDSLMAIYEKMFGTMYGVDNVLRDITNTIATDFVVENYDNMVKTAYSMNVAPDKVHDIVHDVYMSLRRSEENGDGYDETRGANDGCISVAEFVYGRLKGYAYNTKYSASATYKTEVSASCSGDEMRDMDAAQAALYTAATYDPTSELDEELAIAEEIEALVTFASGTELNIKFILKNISYLANTDFDISLLNNLRTFLKNEEHAELFTSVVTYAGKNPVHYNELVSTI